MKQNILCVGLDVDDSQIETLRIAILYVRYWPLAELSSADILGRFMAAFGRKAEPGLVGPLKVATDPLRN